MPSNLVSPTAHAACAAMIASAVFAVLCAAPNATAEQSSPTATAASPSTPDWHAALLASYPDHLDRIDGNTLIWRDGTRMALDDGNPNKSPADLLATSDIEDMFAQRYPLGAPSAAPAENADPGRARNEAFFTKMYGDCRHGVLDTTLVDVVWLSSKRAQRLRVTPVNGVADKLAAVSRELDALPERFTKFLAPSEGTYNCRVIAGTTRLSAHATATAIDIARAHGHYWRWSEPSGGPAYRNEIPYEIVAIFEKHGFIWGGKWAHYDTLHFEYRPEILRAGSGPR